jgi:hypothetical protein
MCRSQCGRTLTLAATDEEIIHMDADITNCLLHAFFGAAPCSVDACLFKSVKRILSEVKDRIYEEFAVV